MPRKPLTAEQKAARKAARIARELAKPDRELEKPIQDRIVAALEALGCLVERRGEGGGRGGMRGGSFKTGEPDLRVSYRGLTFGIEVKRDANEPLRADQIAWYRANSRNVPYFVCCTVEQAIDSHRAVDFADVREGASDMRVPGDKGELS